MLPMVANLKVWRRGSTVISIPCLPWWWWENWGKHMHHALSLNSYCPALKTNTGPQKLYSSFIQKWHLWKAARGFQSLWEDHKGMPADSAMKKTAAILMTLPQKQQMQQHQKSSVKRIVNTIARLSSSTAPLLLLCHKLSRSALSHLLLASPSSAEGNQQRVPLW